MHASVHLSLSGDLNLTRMEQASAQTDTIEYTVAGTSTEAEQYLFIGPEGRNVSTQAGVTTATQGTQTELWVRETDTVLVVPGGTSIRLG